VKAIALEKGKRDNHIGMLRDQRELVLEMQSLFLNYARRAIAKDTIE
jgi:hypothetical protein